MWGSVLIALGLGGLGLGIYRAAMAFSQTAKDTTEGVKDSGVSKLAERVSNEGVLALLPPGLITGGQKGGSADSGSGDRSKDPAAWGSLIGNLGKLGIDIYKTAAGTQPAPPTRDQREPD